MHNSHVNIITAHVSVLVGADALVANFLLCLQICFGAFAGWDFSGFKVTLSTEVNNINMEIC